MFQKKRREKVEVDNIHSTGQYGKVNAVINYGLCAKVNFEIDVKHGIVNRKIWTKS